MQVSGTFQQVFDYLRRLELLDRLVVVDSLQLSAGAAEGAGPSRLEADIKARIFSTGTAAPVAATAAARTTATSPDTAALPKVGG